MRVSKENFTCFTSVQFLVWSQPLLNVWQRKQVPCFKNKCLQKEIPLIDFASQVQTVASTESFNSGIHLQRSLTATNRDAASQTVLSLTEIHVCSLLSLFLSLLLMFSPEIFQMNCVRPVKTASQLSYSPGAMQLPAHAHPRLLKVAVACWHLRQTLTLCSSQSATQNPRARDKEQQRRKPPNLSATPCTWLRKRGAHLISGSVAAFEVLNQFFSTYHGLLTDWHLWSQQPVQTSVTAIINEPSHITAVFPSTI